MTLPSYGEIDLALLLELARVRRPVRPLEMRDPVSAHFPLLTDEDKNLLRKDGRMRVWYNMIAWSRDHLRVRGLLADVGPGLWAVNENGRGFLRQLLRVRGIADPDALIDSSKHLQDALGASWARPLRARPTGPNTPRSRPPAAELPSHGGPLALTQEAEIRAVRQTILDRLGEMQDYEFENAVGHILDALGFSATQVVGGPGDAGVDVRTVLKNDLVSATVAVQVKRQRTNIGPKEISYLRDRSARRADKLLFITTSDYTAGAREVAEEEGAKPVQLVTGEELAGLMIRHRIGVSSSAVERFEIDEDFFQG